MLSFHAHSQSSILLGVCLFAAIIAVVLQFNSIFSADPNHGNRLHSGDYQISASVEKPVYKLGEQINVHYTVKNVGSKPFTIDTGGDYRGATRQLRYIVELYNPDGTLSIDPYELSFLNCMGGIGGPRVLAPGAYIDEPLQLSRYRRIDGPGYYQVCVKHDLGWTESLGKTGTAEFNVAMPDLIQAKDIFDKAIADKGNDVDFDLFSYPVYLPLLEEFAEKQMEKIEFDSTPRNQMVAADGANALSSLDGISKISGTRATEFLLRAAHRKNETSAISAWKALSQRLYVDGAGSERKRRESGSWNESLRKDMLKLSETYLDSSDFEQVKTAAFVFECIGTRADESELLANQQRLSAVKFNGDVGDDAWREGALAEIELALNMIQKR